MKVSGHPGILAMRNGVRWKQRFENSKRALRLLQEAFARNPDEISDLEKEGAIQRFEYMFELAAIEQEPLRRHIDEFGKTLYRSPAASA